MSESGALIQRQGDQVDVPLSPVSGRFPLGLGTFAAPTSDEPESCPGVRPYGLRFATIMDRSSVEVLPAWQFCPQRQIAVVTDEPTKPWYRHWQAEGSMETTGASPDGQGSTGNEEWTPDYTGDAAG